MKKNNRILNWLSLLMFSIGTLVGMAVAGGIISHQLAAWRSRANKRREYRVGYLIEVFRSLCEVSRRPQSNVMEACDEIDRIVYDIQFLGND